MSYEVRRVEKYSVVMLSGEVDLHCSPQARKVILDCVDKNECVLVDLSLVEYIDSSGVASLVEGYQKARKQDLPFGLVGVSDAAMSVLKLARLDQVFPIYDTIEESIKADH
jgi:anti-sigma B factor antagonist